MRTYQWVMAALVVSAFWSASGRSQERFRLFGRRAGGDCPPSACVPSYPPALPGEAPRVPTDAGAGPNPADQANQPPNSAFNEALASAGEGGTQPAAGYMPGFFGDMLGGCTTTVVGVPTPGEGNFVFFRRVTICSPDIAQASGIKISESDSPRPVDRFYYLYNFYGNINVTDDPGTPLLDVHRHLIGFEKTLFGDNFSVGMRLPFFSFAGGGPFDTGFTGDLTIITKLALVNNPRTGNVISGGLVLSVPTGGSPSYFDPNGTRTPAPRNLPVEIQPYFGYVWSPFARLYVHGFHSIIVPTDSNEPTFMANDMGVGFWLYRNPADQFVRGIIPTVEIHINTPFDHTEPAVAPGQVQMLTSVNLTTGFYVALPRSLLGCAVGIPLAYGPHTIEAIASYTLRF